MDVRAHDGAFSLLSEIRWAPPQALWPAARRSRGRRGRGLNALDVDRASRHQSRDGADRREDRRECGADDSRRQRELGQRPPVLPNPHVTEVALCDELLNFLQDLVALEFNGVPALLCHFLPPAVRVTPEATSSPTASHVPRGLVEPALSCRRTVAGEGRELSDC